MKKEVEVLYRLRGTKKQAISALAGLEADGAKATLDLYFFDPKRSALKPERGRLKECFRLRRKNGRASLTYKIDHFRGDNWFYSDEHETEIADFDAAAAILRLLGLRPLVTVKMKKTVFVNDVYEIAVEEVDGLGLFIEAECRRPVDEKRVDEEKQRIRRFMDELGVKVGEEMNSGKPELLLRRRRRHRKTRKTKT